jgi:hypothetical protein
MRRFLVLTDESARHPFLATLPPHVRHMPDETAGEGRRRLSMRDLRQFVMAYCACFVAVTTFIF